MGLQLRIVPPGGVALVEELLESSFRRSGRESRLFAELARGYPAFDHGLVLVAEEDGRALGCAVFVPRTIRIRGAAVRAAIAAPFGVLPEARRRGVGRFLHDAALGALRDRGVRVAIVIGSPEFYGALGYETAFNAYVARVPASILPAPAADAPGRWTGLASGHLAGLCEIQAACYASITGSEVRHAAAIDWESAVEGAYTLVHEVEGDVAAYVRFRLRGGLEVPECGVRDERAVEPVLAFLRRLAGEHRKSQIEVELAPPHPVARALFHRGAIGESHNLGGASLMKVVDWPGLWRDIAASTVAALERCRRPSISLGIDGAIQRLTAKRGRLVVGAGRDPHRHVDVPPGWAAGLVTGQRGAVDLLFDARVRERSRLFEESIALLEALFPLGTPMWTYAPVFEIADE